jgi:hypothetical protein
MKLSNLAKYALAISAAAAMLAACSNSGGPSLAPAGGSSGIAGQPNLNTHIAVRWQPTKSKGRGLYQYISNFGAADVSVFDYPKSDKQIGTIGGAPSGFCTSGKRTFWEVLAGEIEEFKVGGGVIKVLKVPNAAGCAIDPSTGNLAALINSGQVVIYKMARGKGIASQTPLMEVLLCGYDNKSNLYCDGFNSNNAFGFVELPHGTSTWVTLSLSNSIEFPGAVQWDGKYITINDQEAHEILGYTCRGTTCTLKRTVVLSGASDCDGTWLGNGYVVCPDAGNNDAVMYKYPAGGSPIATLKGSFSEPLAAVQVEK